MTDRHVSLLGTISEELEDNGPVPFTLARLRKQEHLFAHRAALFYTPTENIPESCIGSGPLDVALPVATPDYTQIWENPALWSPRFWVELLQRETGKLRWRPMYPARIKFVRYDYFTVRSDHVFTGVKGLLDALKIRTTGRRDRIYLYYFGAIADDAPGFVEVSCEQRLVAHPKNARIRLTVSGRAATSGPAPKDGATPSRARTTRAKESTQGKAASNFAVHQTGARVARPGW